MKLSICSLTSCSQLIIKCPPESNSTSLLLEICLESVLAPSITVAGSSIAFRISVGASIFSNGTLSLIEGLETKASNIKPSVLSVTGNTEKKTSSIKSEISCFDNFLHIDLGTNLDIIDIERAAKVSGKRFTYLKREATLLEFALIRYVLDAIIDESFLPIIPPVLVKREAMYGGGFLPSGEDDIFWIKDKNLCLAGTSEVPLVAMHMNEILDERKLPLYYAGFSTCFRTEAGSHGRDTKGIFRVHQFDKLELFKFTTPETSWDEHEKLLETVERLYRELDLHYRIINVCAGELGTTAAKKYDLELWLPGQGKYREVVSCSNCTDYQARRLNIRCRSGNEIPRIVHTLNSTAVAIGRVIIAILENYQQEDGSILIPDKLAQYSGFQKIALTNEK